MIKTFRLAVLSVLLITPILLGAQTARLRLGSVLPANSLWDRSLKEMANGWQQATGGRVRLQVRPSSGDESTLLRRMRMNNPQVAALSPLGLQEIDEAFNVFGVPFFFESEAEAVQVLEDLTPRLRAVLAENNLVLLNWGHGGWVHIFSGTSIATLDDLRGAKLFTSAGDDGAVNWYKQNGFQPVPLALTDVLMGLNTGLIDAYPSSPYSALVFQWYRQTSHMLDVPLAPLFGATVMSQRAWQRISDADQKAILDVAADTQQSIFVEVPQQDDEAVREMKSRGLNVAGVSESQASALRSEAENLTASWRGSMVPGDIYDAAVEARNRYRSR